jgi:hypothetical protein
MRGASEGDFAIIKAKAIGGAGKQQWQCLKRFR